MPTDNGRASGGLSHPPARSHNGDRALSFGRLGVEGSNFIDQLAASVVGVRDGGSVVRKGVVKERLLQIISVTTQVAISRRVARFKLQLRDRQIIRRSRGGGDDRPTPMA